METIFFHFLIQQSTATSGSSFFFNWNIFFSASLIFSFQLVKTSFLSTGNSIFFIPSFFLLLENITEIWGKSNFKVEHIPASGHNFFRFFQIFVKVKVVLLYSKSVFFNKFTRLMQTNFLLMETVFFVQSHFAAIRSH